MVDFHQLKNKLKFEKNILAKLECLKRLNFIYPNVFSSNQLVNHITSIIDLNINDNLLNNNKYIFYIQEGEVKLYIN